MLYLEVRVALRRTLDINIAKYVRIYVICCQYYRYRISIGDHTSNEKFLDSAQADRSFPPAQFTFGALLAARVARGVKLDDGDFCKH